jgi:predicted esterase
VNPHLGAPVGRRGPAPVDARAAAILLCGRDQELGFMLDVVERVGLDDVAFVVLEAGGRTWYPGRFWQPHAAHVPWLGWSIEACEQALEGLATAGVEPGRIVVGGFSQGACIVAEWVAQRPRAYAGVGLLTGSLLGPGLATRELPPLTGLQVVAVTSAFDDWVPLDLAEASARCFERAGAAVDLRVTVDREHAVGDDGVAALRELLRAVP